MNASREYGDGGKGQWRIFARGGVVALLGFAAILQAMTGAPQWTASDYVVVACLLGAPLVVFEFVIRHSPLLSYRVASGLALLAISLLVWINGAVGIIGSEDNPANLMYVGVVLIAVAGGLIAQFRAAGLATTMWVAAAGQVVVTLVAMIGGLGLPETGPVALAILNGLFVSLWLASATLFGVAAQIGRQEVAS